MALIPLKFPPGFYRNGTPNQRKGRWVDGNLVRHHDGSMRPIGGWTARTVPQSGTAISLPIVDPALEAARDAFAWRDNSQGQNVVFGTNLALYHLSSLGTVTDVTYAGYAQTGGGKDPSTTTGYGQGAYGVGAYGVANDLSGAEAVAPSRWYMTNFGELLLSGSRNNGTIYELDIATLTMSAVANAPDNVQDAIVSDERQVVAIGGDSEPRRLQASDIENRTDWTPAPANQAIDRVLAGNGRLLRVLRVQRQLLILGENDATVARYIGAPFVYSTELAGEQCGPLAAEAVARTDSFAVWWGDRNFWLYDGAVKPLNCEVIDYLYDDVDLSQATKITTITNQQYSEITWYYQSQNAAEIDSYVTWNYTKNAWYTGRLARTAGVDRGVTSSPILVDAVGALFNHEQDGVLPDGEVTVTSGPIVLGQGESRCAVRYIYPDTAGFGGITYNLLARNMPNSDEFTYGPYADQNNAPIPTRAAGREIRLQAVFSLATSEFGEHRLDVALPQSGTGRR